eukprot:CAMPEP_0167829484 /NCGR_PEP_ID=MMETSP0112_2-20121227/12215_1 /TAXON_ID=91324 /ORGANISM="Lotharella globosa, Strain CCCM811" /LENGTH=95 /DNA_ID=CAMNT_0007733243 /DNA_START=1062 /DNA_END=1349 /DNA_ORIENTATION=+
MIARNPSKDARDRPRLRWGTGRGRQVTEVRVNCVVSIADHCGGDSAALDLFVLFGAKGYLCAVLETVLGLEALEDVLRHVSDGLSSVELRELLRD